MRKKHMEVVKGRGYVYSIHHDDTLHTIQYDTVLNRHSLYYVAGTAVVLIVDNQSPIINCFILETIKYKILVTLYKSH